MNTMHAKIANVNATINRNTALQSGRHVDEALDLVLTVEPKGPLAATVEGRPLLPLVPRLAGMLGALLLSA